MGGGGRGGRVKEVGFFCKSRFFWEIEGRSAFTPSFSGGKGRVD